MNNIELLLHQVQAVQRAAFQDVPYDYNIFKVLRRTSDEVNLHSRFLFDLLNPEGLHGQGKRFLSLFLQQVGLSSFDLQGVYVKREYRHIDLFIANENSAVIIENKIYAGDQDRQLERYYRTVKREKFREISILYLTPFGDEPSDQSVGDLDRELITTISYKSDILIWLEACIKSDSLPAVVREPIVQYRRVIEELTGQTLWKGSEYIMKIKDMIMDEESLELATDISQALVEAKIDVQFSFWQELERQLGEKGYEIYDYQKYSKGEVERFYKQDNKHYGLVIPLLDIPETGELVFKISIGWGTLYGFMLLKGGKRANTLEDPLFDNLAGIVETWGDDWKRSKWMLWKPATKMFNFLGFNDSVIFSLVDVPKRQQHVAELVEEVTETIDRLMREYDETRAVKSTALNSR